MVDAAVLGASGRTGQEVTQQLLQQGRTVRAVVRNPAAYKGPRATEVVQGDVSDPQSLRQALAGTKGVVFAASGSGYFSADQVDAQGVKHVADVAKEVGGVKRVVLVSSALVTPKNRWHPIRIMLNNMRWGLMDAKFKGEEHLRKSGVPYTIVRPGGLSNDPAGNALLVAQQGDTGAGRVSRADVAAVCVAALTDPAAKNVTLELTSKLAPQAPGGSVPPLQQQLKSLFTGLKPDAPAA